MKFFYNHLYHCTTKQGVPLCWLFIEVYNFIIARFLPTNISPISKTLILSL
jgi:hypothetical protein